jgi:hypothetical protein
MAVVMKKAATPSNIGVSQTRDSRPGVAVSRLNQAGSCCQNFHKTDPLQGARSLQQPSYHTKRRHIFNIKIVQTGPAIL